MENKITFTTLVKEEICSYNFNEWQLLSLLAGFVKVNGSLSLSSEGIRVVLTSENGKIAKLIYNSFKKLFSVAPSFSYSRKMNLDKGIVYRIIIDNNAMEILEKLNIMDDGCLVFPRQIVLEEKLRYFIAGAFLASGSVNSPAGKNYHLQLVIGEEEDAKYFLKLLKRFRNDRSMEFKMIQRSNKFVLYLKKADQIGTFLSVIYAHECFLDFENIRIEKDYINSDNRLQICYNANYQKTLTKGQEIIKEINKVKAYSRDTNLSDKEKIIMNIRLENEEYSLSKIVEVAKEEHNLSISKSGVNHILAKIHKIYKEIIENEKN